MDDLNIYDPMFLRPDVFRRTHTAVGIAHMRHPALVCKALMDCGLCEDLALMVTEKVYARYPSYVRL